MATYWVYITASRTRVLYVGMTNDLARRIQEHKHAARPGFTGRYRVNRLVFFESFREVRDAIQREKEIKGWLRAKKVALIERQNPDWVDLATEEGPSS